MERGLRQIKKEVGISLGINFGLIAILGALLFTLPKGPQGMTLASLAGLVFMIVPCFSVMVTMKYVSKEQFNKHESSFVNWIIVSSIIIYISGLIAILSKIESLALIINLGVYAVSVVLIVKVLKHGKELERFNLRFKKNLSLVVKCVLIFVGIKVVLILVGIFGLKETLSIQPVMVAILPISLVENFFLAFFMFLGEEFGWRYYLQPRLQVLFGKRMGVIILGVIWGIWHLPLCFTLYSPDSPINCVISHVTFCASMGIFLAYVYMKTENIFAPILIHIVNNVLAIVLNNGSLTSTISTSDLIIGIVINAVIFVPFLFTKEFKKEESLVK
ncbi:MAG: CPBP family intramembrane glutamic endopeptidase [Sarcina sp.]